jgi:hypothetical protein
MIVGYARVSTDGQSLESQQALKGAGAEKVFAEKVSGAVTDRKALAQAVKALGPSDVLLVTRLDRLARSTRDLLNILDGISKAGAKFKSLADAWADTTTPHGELMVTILAGLATSRSRGVDNSRAAVLWPTGSLMPTTRSSWVAYHSTSSKKRTTSGLRVYPASASKRLRESSLKSNRTPTRWLTSAIMPRVCGVFGSCLTRPIRLRRRPIRVRVLRCR